MGLISNLFLPDTWFVKWGAAVDMVLQPGASNKLDTPKASEPKDAQKLKRLEVKADATPPKLDPSTVKLKKSVHALERAVFASHSEAQRKKYYEKAMKIWRAGIDKISDYKIFGERPWATKESLFTKGGPVQKVQAGLWMIDSRYGNMLGSFGLVGIDGHNNYFTDKAVEKFCQDYNAGLVRGVLKPEQPLKNAKEARAEIIRMAEATMVSKSDADRERYISILCEQARINLSHSDKQVRDRAYSTYFFTCEYLSASHLAEEAPQLRRMIEDTKLDPYVRGSAMHLYGKIAKIHALPVNELEMGFAMMQRMAEDETLHDYLKSVASEFQPVLAEKVAPYQTAPFDSRESVLASRAFSEAMPGEAKPPVSLDAVKRYQKVFDQLKAATWLCAHSLDKVAGDRAFESAKSEYLKVSRQLGVSAFVTRDTLHYFADRSVFSRGPKGAAA